MRVFDRRVATGPLVATGRSDPLLDRATCSSAPPCGDLREQVAPRDCRISIEAPLSLTAARLVGLSDTYSDLADEAFRAGDKANGQKYEKYADHAFETARAGGCAWAIWRVLPSGLGSSGGRATFGG